MRRQFLINKPFQFRFMLFVCGVAFIGIIIQILTILYFVSEMLRIEPVNGVAISEHLYSYLHMNSARFLLAFVVSAMAFFLFSLMMSMFFSHKIAGPLYRLRTYLSNNSETSDKISKLTFRQGDFFQEIPEEFNKFAKAKGIDN